MSPIATPPLRSLLIVPWSPASTWNGFRFDGPPVRFSFFFPSSFPVIYRPGESWRLPRGIWSANEIELLSEKALPCIDRYYFPSVIQLPWRCHRPTRLGWSLLLLLVLLVLLSNLQKPPPLPPTPSSSPSSSSSSSGVILLSHTFLLLSSISLRLKTGRERGGEGKKSNYQREMLMDWWKQLLRNRTSCDWYWCINHIICTGIFLLEENRVRWISSWLICPDLGWLWR